MHMKLLRFLSCILSTNLAVTVQFNIFIQLKRVETIVSLLKNLGKPINTTVQTILHQLWFVFKSETKMVVVKLYCGKNGLTTVVKPFCEQKV